ncbi:serpentine type 7TM GPCR chemoreceptor srbc domain-containing protein [Ditylenchus destructor]|nr:serpentine type 7TM GPCR chemoreceptor srbc domain-containing protein [Ditylenchus destructor]
MDYLNLVELIARISSILLSLLALAMICRILRQIFSSYVKSNSNFSVPYFIYFICWILEIITVIPFSAYVLAEWKPSGDYIGDNFGLFLVGVLNFVATVGIPIAVFFLTIDRIVTITFLRNMDYQRKILAALCIFTIIICMLINLYAAFQELPLLPITACRVYMCLFRKTGLQTFTVTRMIGGFFNCVTGLFFLIKLWKIQRAHSVMTAAYTPTVSGSINNNANTKLNRLAVLVIATEFFLNFCPQLIALLLYKMFDTLISEYVGAYNVVLPAIEICMLSTIYSKMLKKSEKEGSTASVHAKPPTIEHIPKPDTIFVKQVRDIRDSRPRHSVCITYTQSSNIVSEVSAPPQ